MDVSARDNLWALFEALAELPGCASGTTAGARWHHGPHLNPMFRGVWDAQTVDGALAALDLLSARGAELVFVWLAEGARPDGLDEALVERGASAFELEAPTTRCTRVPG